ncbi:DUF4862 family protein [Herbiconiux sp. P17]|uniref:DUF4862 family protein n=1 Tax=Herbiconiux wuyangfengii TaxID=3342794 RepID=UPI0035B862E0
MIDGLTVGAYAAAPQRTPLSGPDEDYWYALLGDLDHATGIEVFFRGSLHPLGPRRLAHLLPEGWHVVATMLPQAIARQAADPGYGLASDSVEGRRAAVADGRALFGELQTIADLLGRDPTRAVHLHSAPRAALESHARSSAAALTASLGELAELADEHGLGAALVVEHCDALVPGQPPAKGYLTLDAEIEAVRDARIRSTGAGTAPVYGQSVNWGRSAIEGRSADTAVAHLAALDRAATLAGLMFSGAPSTDGVLGAAWNDLHNPLAADDPSSLLTRDEIRRSLGILSPDAASRLLYLGAKVQDPADSDDLSTRLDPLRAVLATVHTEWNRS